MYTIDYCKDRKDKPIIRDYVFFDDGKIILPKGRYYSNRLDIVRKCWNVKSVTIDLEDLDYVMYDHSFRVLADLYSRIKRKGFNEAKTITILNNNSINLMYIYEIINCWWMINADEKLDSSKLSDAARNLMMYIEQYNVSTDEKTRKIIEDEIELIRHYMDSLIKKISCTRTDDSNNLLLSKRFMINKN